MKDIFKRLIIDFHERDITGIIEREIKGLITGMEETSVKEALLITNDCEEEIKINNKKIQILPLWKWLLDS